MYVWFRFIRMMATAKGRGPYRAGEESRFTFRCLPSDVDFNGHMNNARYLMLADVGRIDIFQRSGMIRLRRERGWVPMMGGVEIAFLREIKLWRRFELISGIATWDGVQIVGHHRFLFEDGTISATALTTAGIYDLRNRRFVPFDEVMEAIGIKAERPEPTEAQRIFMQSHAMLRAAAKRAGPDNGATASKTASADGLTDA